MLRKSMRSCFAVVVLAALSPAAFATWSIVLIDTEAGEVAVGTVTCLNEFDLLALVPVVVVGKGGGHVQSFGDFDGIRRPIIFEELMNGTPPEQILEILEGIRGHQNRQYGIADTKGGKVTFSGSANGDWAGGVTGSKCSMHYAVQGNVLAGACVVQAIEQAILDTDGDMAAKLMAGMQAAREMGGDGRCSCDEFPPTSCGCPVSSLKSGHIGGMVVARIGDTDDDACDAAGCVDGDYFMRLNVAFQQDNDPDPVAQLLAQFNDWRTGLQGRPDAVQSTAQFDPPSIPSDGSSTTTLTIALRDWAGVPVVEGIASFAIEHAPDSAGLSTIGEVVDNGNGSFNVQITAGIEMGLDRFRVTVDDGIRPVILMPDPALEYCTPPDCVLDCNDNGASDSCDIGDGVSIDCNLNNRPDECDVATGTSLDCDGNVVPDECEPDCNGNSVTDACDISSGFSTDQDANGIPDDCHGILRVPAKFATIQAAVDSAKPGDTVLLADGTYTGPGNKDIDPGGKSILIKNLNGPTSCIIDCENNGRGFIFQNGETRQTVIERLTITNGLAPQGGAISCLQNSNPTIRNCLLLGNTASDKGGAVHTDASSPRITRCALLGNTAEGLRGGGGLFVRVLGEAPATEIDNSLVAGNTAISGGGAYLVSGGLAVRHCTFYGNSANSGGGAYVWGSSNLTISSSIFWADTADQGPEVTLSSALNSMEVTYSDVAGGAAGVAAGGTLSWGAGNIGEDPVLHDPLFFDAHGPDNDPATLADNNYHLVNISPAIDAGDPAFTPDAGEADLDGNTRVEDGDGDDKAATDMGCYERRSCTTDVDGDGQVDALDLALLLAGWGQNPGHPADFDGNEIVDAEDLAILIAGWGPCL